MTNHRGLLELHVSSGAYIKHQGRTFRVRKSGIRLLKVLRLLSRRLAMPGSGRVLCLRPHLRKVITHCAPRTLACVIDTCEDVNVLRVAIWIAGRARVHGTVGSIVRHANHTDMRVRLEVVRSLGRLSAWVHLQRLSIGANHVQTRHWAARNMRPSVRSYSERLQGFLAITQAHTVPSRPADFVVLPASELSRGGKKPRTRWQIRRVLRRIHWLVRRRRRQRRFTCVRST
ncbi:MAG: HEAT repeat domain-containing protein [Pirellulales bacterium]|nr:HEAT repeat domain-containing protein [Pirellulales bacterium]